MMLALYTAPSGKQFTAIILRSDFDETCGLNGEQLYFIEFTDGGQKMTTWIPDYSVLMWRHPVRAEALEYSDEGEAV